MLFQTGDDRSHLWDNVRGRDEADDAYTVIEDPLDTVDDLIERELLTEVLPLIAADLVVLAVGALHVAVGEEDVADPVFSAQDRFLPGMLADRGDMVTDTSLAITERS
jgi:hypothetical protein